MLQPSHGNEKDRKEKFALPQQGSGIGRQDASGSSGAFQTKLCLGLFFLTGAGDNTITCLLYEPWFP